MATTGCTYSTSRQQCRKARHSQNESGRSMVEMLGVLAIAGVLTIGGVAGYNMAITKHRVNELHEFLRRTTVLTQSLPSLTAEGVQEIIDEQASSYLATVVMCSAGTTGCTPPATATSEVAPITSACLPIIIV